jgi:hypothetical protein
MFLYVTGLPGVHSVFLKALKYLRPKCIYAPQLEGNGEAFDRKAGTIRRPPERPSLDVWSPDT